MYRVLTCSIKSLKQRFQIDKDLVWDKVKVFSVCAHTHTHTHTHTYMLSLCQDDKVSLDFVVAASNLRAFNYNIPIQSRFDVKCKETQWPLCICQISPPLPLLSLLSSPHTHTHTAMAGSIIPAIATTNAVIAALIVMEALKVVAGDYSKCKMVCALPPTHPSSQSPSPFPYRHFSPSIPTLPRDCWCQHPSLPPTQDVTSVRPNQR